MPHRRLQIALEFMILFSLVLVLFLFMFMLISSQRSQTLSNQVFSQEQLIAQNIAAQLDRALQSGNGYTASVPIFSTIGTVGYQLVVAKNGAVIVNITVGKQVMQAMVYSSAKNVVSNPSFLQANTFYYSLPIANGTLSIQNSFGTICVDYTCPTSSNFAANITLSVQSVHAVAMNGGSSYISIPASNSLSSPSITNKITMEATVRLNSLTSEIFEYGTSGVYGLEVGPIESETPAQPGNFIATVGTTVSGILDCDAPFQLKTNVWYQLAATYDGTTLVKYVNGKQYCVKTPGVTLASSATPLTFAELGAGDIETENTLVADAQIYNSSLSASQVQTLYQGGIGGLPINTNTLVAWWPLNGDANDYSGNGNNANVFNGPIIYKAVAQISAKVTDMFGRPVANALVGFTTTLGNLTTNTGTIGTSATNYTNSNGIAIAFLSQYGTNGQALVKATVFNANTAQTANLIGWWPLNLGQGSTFHDISGNNYVGALKGYTFWSDPDYVAGFDGATSYVAVPTSSSLQLAAQQTWSFWFLPNSFVNNQRLLGLGVPSASGLEAYINGAQGLTFNTMATSCTTVTSIAKNTWYHAALTWDGTNLKCYLNGMSQNVISSGFSGSMKATNTLFFGTDSFTPAKYFFHGAISDLQVYNIALSPNQIMQLYNGGIGVAPVLTANTVGWWPLNGDSIDYSGNGNNGVIFGNLNFANTTAIPNTNANATGLLAEKFNGANSIVSTWLTPNALSSFTVTMWANPANLIRITSAANGYTLLNSSQTETNNFQMWLNGGNALGSIPGQGDEELGIGSNIYHGYGISNSSWNFLAIAISNKKASFYANGAQPYNISIVKGPYSVLDLAVAQPALHIPYFNGSIADLQIYNTTLKPTQIMQIYERGIAGMPLNNSATSYGLISWYPLNGDAKDYSGNGNNGTATNAIYTQSLAAVPPHMLNSFGSYGVNFNGQNSYIQSSFTSGSAFTIFFWLYKGNYASNCESVLGKSSSSQMLIYSVTQNGCSAGSEQNTPLTFKYVDLNSVTHTTINSIALPTSTWVNAALTFNGASGNVIWYVNGANPQTYTGLNSMNPDSNPLNIGYGDNYFNGSIANVQFYSSVLSPAQIQQLYQSAMPPSASATVPLSWFP